MARLDLKNCKVRAVDGTRDAGAVNNVGGYVAGTTTVTYDGTAAQIPDNSLITFGTSPYRYEVTASTSTTVTFTPGLRAAVTDNLAINVRGLYLSWKMGDGTLTYSAKQGREYLLERGKIDEIRNGDEQPMDVNIAGVIEYFTGHASDPNGGLPSITDALTKTGLASAWVSTDSDPCRPYCVDIEIDHRPICDNAYAELVVFPYFRYESLDADLKAATFSIPGKCNVLAPTFTRYDQTP